jgi:hypothetical protein
VKCPHCGEEIVLKGTPSGTEQAIEHYYRSKAAGSRITIEKVAQQTGFSAGYLREVKMRYDRDGKWGSRNDKRSRPRRRAVK